MRLGFIGFGNMAVAIAKGLIAKGVLTPSDIAASARDFGKLSKNAAAMGIYAAKSNAETADICDMVVLAVKPYQIKDVVSPIKDKLRSKIVVSIAAGVMFSDLEGMLKSGTRHISAIPNTPVAVGEGIMICEEKHSLSPEDLRLFEGVFSPIALIEFLDAAHFSAAGTLSGCTPAFTAMYLEALGDAGVKHGLARAQSYRLAAKMLKGVGALYLESGEHPGAMKDAVCSPGGTTIKGVAALEQSGFRGAVIGAIDAIEE